MSNALKWKIAQFAEIRWWQQYLKKKSVKDYNAYKVAYWQGFLKKISPDFAIRSDEKVLDAGCGPAGIFIALPNAQVTAIDPLLEQYEEKLPHFSTANHPNTQFIPQGLEVFQSEEKYDHAFCLNCINHVAKLNLALDNLVQATQKGGKVYLSIDAHNHSFLKWLFRAIPLDILHPHQYDLAEYEAMLTSRGCVIEQSIRYNKANIFDYYLLVARRVN